jgi:hypothetical protein
MEVGNSVWLWSIDCGWILFCTLCIVLLKSEFCCFGNGLSYSFSCFMFILNSEFDLKDFFSFAMFCYIHNDIRLDYDMVDVIDAWSTVKT